MSHKKKEVPTFSNFQGIKHSKSNHTHVWKVYEYLFKSQLTLLQQLPLLSCC